MFLHEIIKPDMICLEGHREALEREAAENDPVVVRERAERAARISERRFQDELSREKAKSQGIFGGGDLREMEKSVSFGVSFIFTFFLSGISGYFLGKVFFGLNDGLSMILAVVALIGTLILESTLFIMKTWRNDKVLEKRKKEDADSKANARRLQSSDLSQLIRDHQNASTKSSNEKKND